MGSDMEDGKAVLAGSSKPVDGMDKPRHVKRHTDCFLAFCRLLNFVTGICALLCIVAHAMALTLGPPVQSADGAIQQALRVYGILLGVVILFAEFEWERFLLNFRFLSSWLGRGSLQIFECVLTLEMATAQGDSDFHKSLQLYRTLSGVALLACSGIYIAGGICCFGALRRARNLRAKEAERVQNDLDALDRKRDELKALLGVYTRD
ncbi:hypothetical protein WJX72_008458 [[Myrmecia] bisecta]|uniref:Golgi apparatus membrane protein TVP15 n=1 Tax=[Myrmecia] bisecta TaxID=41462 RepID=A0AAW1P6X8_9CHLO